MVVEPLEIVSCGHMLVIVLYEQVQGGLPFRLLFREHVLPVSLHYSGDHDKRVVVKLPSLQIEGVYPQGCPPVIVYMHGYVRVQLAQLAE